MVEIITNRKIYFDGKSFDKGDKIKIHINGELIIGVITAIYDGWFDVLYKDGIYSKAVSFRPKEIQHIEKVY